MWSFRGAKTPKLIGEADEPAPFTIDKNLLCYTLEIRSGICKNTNAKFAGMCIIPVKESPVTDTRQERRSRLFLTTIFALNAGPEKIPLTLLDMLSREDFIFTIGYDGPAAVVDRQAKKRFSSLSARELAEKGMFRAAYSAAIWSKNPQELETVLEIFNKASYAPLDPGISLERLFGIFPVEVKRSIAL